MFSPVTPPDSAASSSKAAPGRPFVKGQSGNPKGRAKVDLIFRQKCRDVSDELVFDAWKKEVAERGDHWMEASKMLTAYGYGKPTERHEVEADEGLLAALGIHREQALDLAREVASMSPDEQTEVARGKR